MTRRAGMNEMNMLLSFLSCLVWSGLIQHWHWCANQALQELRQPVAEVRLLAGHVHGTRPGTPPAPAQQQAESR